MEYHRDADAEHQAFIASANNEVVVAAQTAQADPAHPIYHVAPAGKFMNDPNGPIWHNGRYHLFYQHLPYWGTKSAGPGWGHASSSDFIFWQHEPIALMPGPEDFDVEAVASGGCIVHDGVPTIIYTGVGPSGQTQCIATSDDSMKVWHKYPGNPVIGQRPDVAGLEDGFRDPCCWKEGNTYRLLVGSGIKDVGGTVLLYQSNNLVDWEFIGPLCVDMGEHCFQWECPAFFPLTKGDVTKHALIVSPLYNDNPLLRSEVLAAVGEYTGDKLTYDGWSPVDYGGPTVYYAPSSFADDKGRRLLWGWIMADRPFEAAWSHCMTLPREVTLGADNTLRYRPAEEISQLRYNHRTFHYDSCGGEISIDDHISPHSELIMTIPSDGLSSFDLWLGHDDAPNAAVHIWIEASEIVHYNTKQAPLKRYGLANITLRLFIDGCIGELYINDTACISASDYAVTADAKLRINATSSVDIDAWDIHSIWNS